MKKFAVIVLLLLVSGLVRGDEYDEAINLIKDGKYDVAVTLLNATIEKKGESVRVRYALGYCAEKQDRNRDAYDQYRIAVALNLATGEDGETAKRVYERLFVLAPRLKPVIEKAWMLEADAAKAATKSDRDYLSGAAKALYDYAFQGVDIDLPVRPPVGTEMPKADIEKALGYSLRRHKVNATKLASNGHYYMMFDEFVSHTEAMAKCKELGGYLVTITTKEEYELVKRLADLDERVENRNLWLGGTINDASNITWTTGEPDTLPRDVAPRDRKPVGSASVLSFESYIFGIAANGRSGGGNVIIKGFMCEWNE